MKSVEFYLIALSAYFTSCSARPKQLDDDSVIFASNPSNRKVGPLPEPDGNLNIFALPVGQGDSQVIQCPDGTLALYDLGSSDYDVDNPDPDSRFMTTEDIKTFFGDQQSLIRNVFITHNHYDHYILLTRVFNETGSDLSELENIYISCTEDDMASFVSEWVDLMSFQGLLRTFNGGSPCGPYDGAACEDISICPNDPDVTSYVMGASMGQHCSDDGNKNMDSIILRLEHGGTRITMCGDFEDETSDWYEDGLQKLMVDYYGDELNTTVYALAHHGASSLANKPIFQEGLSPKAIWASGNGQYSYHHPRCSVIDGFIIYEESICKPNAAAGDEFYCGDEYDQAVPADQRVQPTYVCGLSSGDDTCPDQQCLRTDNDYALYTTTPDPDTIQLVYLRVQPSGSWAFISEITDSPAKS